MKGTLLSLPGIPVCSILWLVISNTVICQEIDDKVNISFGIQKYDPVHVKVEEKNRNSAVGATISFTATNSTYYPFMLVLEFVQFDNLSPRPPAREVKIDHGSNNLFSISPQVPGQGYSYRYSYKYWLKPSDENLNAEYPYLIPLKEGKTANSRKLGIVKFNGTFTGNSGDTIYCMRKGLVTAVPHSETVDFRVSDHDCLEVLHDDGTIMVYHHVKESDAFTSPGKIILPSQPAGIMSDSCYIMVTLMKIGNVPGFMLSQPIKYTIGKPDPVFYNDIEGKYQAVFPREVVIRELKNKEIKLLDKNK